MNTIEEEHYNKLMEQHNKDSEKVLRKEKFKEVVTDTDIEMYEEAPTSKELGQSIKNSNNLEDNPALGYNVSTKEEILKAIEERMEVKTTLQTITIKSLPELLEKSENMPRKKDWWEIMKNDEKIIIEPQLFFEFIKTIVKGIDLDILKDRMEKFQRIFTIATKVGQFALRENTRNVLIEISKEQEIYASGIKNYVLEEDIKKFIDYVKDKVVYFGELKEFPRAIPDDVIIKIEEAQSKNVFDEYWVLYIDYTNESKNIKSNEKKTIEKDPILFGKSIKFSKKLYYICDWIDEYCDLTLEKFVEQMNQLDSKYKLHEIVDIAPLEISKLLDEYKEQEKNLQNTNSYNYHDLAQKEAANNNKLKKESRKKNWFKKLKLRNFT